MNKIFISLIILSSLVFADGDTLIKKEDYGKNWAFTVDKVYIGCESELPFVVVKLGDLPYGLTGHSARMFNRNINPIWRDDPKIKGTKVSLSPFIKKALSFCK
ncbi:MAG: DUF2511 domain-containing protein [Sulfurospirillum sp.]|nr:DUF2511 domain-containing protein [Sulfurospirillum sp.]